ncbi:MAG: exosome complex RNA-binding protein Rrp4 [Thermoplasmatota archaeon]
MKRELILVGDKIASSEDMKPGSGAERVGDHIVAVQSGYKQESRGRVGVIPFNGRYMPKAGDTVVGIVAECNPGNWILDINAPWDAPMHVSEAPWRVDFGETAKYLAPGDAVLCKVLFVDEQKKVQCTLKDRNLTKLDGGEMLEIAPVKVARIIGKNGSMLNLIKTYVECWLFVGQNGRVWVNGEPEEVLIAKEVIRKIAAEAHLPGLTDRVRAFLEEKKPGGVDGDLAFEEEE